MSRNIVSFAEFAAESQLDGALECATRLDPYTDPENVMLDVGNIRRTMRIFGLGVVVLASKEGEGSYAQPTSGRVHADGTISATRSKTTSADLSSAELQSADSDTPPDFDWPTAKLIINRAEAGRRISALIAPSWKGRKTREQAWGRVLNDSPRHGLVDAGKQHLYTNVNTLYRVIDGVIVLGQAAAIGVAAPWPIVAGGVSMAYGIIQMAKACPEITGEPLANKRSSFFPMGMQLDRLGYGAGYAAIHSYAGARQKQQA